MQLTLDISNGLLEDLLENLGVLQLLGDLRNDGLGELLLLALLDLAFVADPGIEDSLGLGGESSLLLKLESLGLELSGFLPIVSVQHLSLNNQIVSPWRPGRAAW